MEEASADVARAPKRVSLNMKATPALRAKIDAAAKESGLSIAQEVERRLIQSISDDERNGGAFNSAFLRLIGARIDIIERVTGSRWPKDRATFEAVSIALRKLMEDFKPDPDNAGVAAILVAQDLVGDVFPAREG